MESSQEDEMALQEALGSLSLEAKVEEASRIADHVLAGKLLSSCPFRRFTVAETTTEFGCLVQEDIFLGDEDTENFKCRCNDTSFGNTRSYTKKELFDIGQRPAVAVKNIISSIEVGSWDTSYLVISCKNLLSNKGGKLEWSAKITNLVPDSIAKFSLCLVCNDFRNSFSGLTSDIVNSICLDQLYVGLL
ncbi:hypothetical protein FNV43_RR21532 [Rhamnella rubrinervis]|uniref:Uncharacterized protein n=1 Tax=Rhamnella rubrinervis TaxID=2594499 RepID=A0A8K0E2G0_9ROSA|nr:hypothetical protein FNV43_RR21532 [Rhamnella rubrinervis]